MTDSGVRHARHALDGDEDSVTAARDHAHAFFGAASPPLDATLFGDVLLAVSELVTNAVCHAPGPCVLILTDDGRRTTIAVSDTHSAAPTQRPSDFSGGGGLGLPMLHAMAGSVSTHQHPGGKTVSVTLRRDR